MIQPHTLGKFRDLLKATAKSPAMLFYLDNFLSADPRAAQRLAAQRAMRQSRSAVFGRPFPPRRRSSNRPRKHERGLNENYGRELMELHTLGVDGGYTQKDVIEVARCFTGWTIEKPRQNPEFKFDERLHDPDPKIVLGKKIHAGGMKDGEEGHRAAGAQSAHREIYFHQAGAALRLRQSSGTRWWIAWRRPFRSSDGDIRAVLHTMIYSPEFWSREAYRAKIKTPFEVGGFRGARAGHRCGYAHAAGAMDGAHRRAAVSMPAADRLFR